MEIIAHTGTIMQITFPASRRHFPDQQATSQAEEFPNSEDERERVHGIRNLSVKLKRLLHRPGSNPQPFLYPV